jgi:hypothetical protein
MEARLTWLVKLVRPVTTISWGGEWIMETKIRLFLVELGGSPMLRVSRLGLLGNVERDRARDLGKPRGV